MRTILKNFTLYDGTENMTARPGCSLVIENGIITKIGDAAAQAGDKVYDLGGAYLMPGLINLHVHLPAGGRPQNKPLKADFLTKLALSNGFTKAFALNLCHGYAMQGLMAGVTTVRAVGGLEYLDTKLRDKINSGKLEGPRIIAADYAIGVHEGHMVGSVAREANTPEQAAAMVEDLAAHNVDFIKLMITGGVMDAKVKGEPGILMMPPEMIKACCGTAHSHGLKVAAHIQSTEGIRAALENGVDSVEHGSVITEAEAELYKKNGAVMVTTISPAMPMAKFERSTLGITEEVAYNSNVVFNNMIEGSKQALAAGVTVGLGTDTGCPYTTHYNMWRELHYFQSKVGVTPQFALHTATLVNARILGLDKEIGSIEEGKCADIVVTNGDPMQDFRALSQPKMVVARGRVYENPVIKKYPACDAELDKYYDNL